MNIERSFIGSCLQNQEVALQVQLNPDCFADKLCCDIWKVIVRGITDPQLILREVGLEHDRDIGDMYSSGDFGMVEEYARLVRDGFRARSVRSALELAARKLDSGRPVDEVIEPIMLAAQSGGESEYRPIMDLMVDLYHDMSEKQDGTNDGRFIPSGYPDVDKLTGGLERGSLVVVAGRPSQGKSAYAMGVCQKVSATHKVCFSSIEMDCTSISYRLVSSISKLDLKALRTTLNFSESAWRKACDVTEKLKTHKLYVDDNPMRSASQIAAQARRHHARHGLDLLMVDYLGLLESESPSIPRHLQVAEMTKIFKRVAKQLDCCVMLLCQLNRDAEGKQPSLSQLRESGSIEQDADIVQFTYRYKEGNQDRAEIIVAKNRNGPTGIVQMVWLGGSASYESMGYSGGFDD
ncbi:MAG: DnaB-like helicase C-terminal domain-containing protein [Gallionellaceae bacterium]